MFCRKSAAFRVGAIRITIVHVRKPIRIWWQARIEPKRIDVVRRNNHLNGLIVGKGQERSEDFRFRPFLGGFGGKFGDGLVRGCGDGTALVIAQDKEGDGQEGDHREHDQRDDQRNAFLVRGSAQ